MNIEAQNRIYPGMTINHKNSGVWIVTHKISERSWGLRRRTQNILCTLWLEDTHLVTCIDPFDPHPEHTMD